MLKMNSSNDNTNNDTITNINIINNNNNYSNDSKSIKNRLLIADFEGRSAGIDAAEGFEKRVCSLFVYVCCLFMCCDVCLLLFSLYVGLSYFEK